MDYAAHKFAAHLEALLHGTLHMLFRLRYAVNSLRPILFGAMRSRGHPYWRSLLEPLSAQWSLVIQWGFFELTCSFGRQRSSTNFERQRRTLFPYTRCNPVSISKVGERKIGNRTFEGGAVASYRLTCVLHRAEVLRVGGQDSGYGFTHLPFTAWFWVHPFLLVLPRNQPSGSAL